MNTAHPLVLSLLRNCPFVERYLDGDMLDLPTVVFGDVARLLRSQSLSERDDAELWRFINDEIESGDEAVGAIIGTGAIETFNDDAVIQRIARDRLSGKALELLDSFRIGWGQPRYDR